MLGLCHDCPSWGRDKVWQNLRAFGQTQATYLTHYCSYGLIRLRVEYLGFRRITIQVYNSSVTESKGTFMLSHVRFWITATAAAGFRELTQYRQTEAGILFVYKCDFYNRFVIYKTNAWLTVIKQTHSTPEQVPGSLRALISYWSCCNPLCKSDRACATEGPGFGVP
jgi:hypothetical protein